MNDVNQPIPIRYSLMGYDTIFMYEQGGVGGDGIGLIMMNISWSMACISLIM